MQVVFWTITQTQLSHHGCIECGMFLAKPPSAIFLHSIVSVTWQGKFASQRSFALLCLLALLYVAEVVEKALLDMGKIPIVDVFQSV